MKNKLIYILILTTIFSINLKAYSKELEGVKNLEICNVEKVLENGNSATKELKKIVKQNHNKLYFKTMGIDKYSRLIGIIYDKDLKDINEQMTQYCSVYKYKN